jgi:hypothetical protein
MISELRFTPEIEENSNEYSSSTEPAAGCLGEAIFGSQVQISQIRHSGLGKACPTKFVWELDCVKPSLRALPNPESPRRGVYTDSALKASLSSPGRG